MKVHLGSAKEHRLEEIWARALSLSAPSSSNSDSRIILDRIFAVVVRREYMYHCCIFSLNYISGSTSEQAELYVQLSVTRYNSQVPYVLH